MPDDIKDVFGRAILDLEFGDTPVGARAFGEGLPGQVMKLATDHDGSTFRAAYTVAFQHAVYVLHVFQKKSRSGVATPKPDRDTVAAGFKAARLHYREHHANEASASPPRRRS
jgi:phage-related protein